MTRRWAGGRRRIYECDFLSALAATIIAALLGLSRLEPVASQTVDPQPLDGLSDDELGRFQAGQAQFSQAHGVGDGLGPIFNARGCAECHAAPGIGGGDATTERQVVLFGRGDGRGGFDPLVELGGPLRSQRTTRNELPGCGLSAEQVPDRANVKGHRQPAPLYGLGLVEAVPDEVILAQIEIGAIADPGEVRGRANAVDGRIGRFGWKAQAATLDEFIGRSLAEEIGITNPQAPDEPAAARGPVPAACDPRADPEDDGTKLGALVDFVRLLGPQPRLAETDAIRHGAAVFEEVGCVACHTPSLRTGPSDIASLSERDVPLFSDLLIHEMGEYLADDIVQGQAGGTDWRTTPLWGLARKTRYLHDGRTTDLRQVIEYHSGEGRAARYRLRKRPKADVEDLLAFLRSL